MTPDAWHVLATDIDIADAVAAYHCDGPWQTSENIEIRLQGPAHLEKSR